MNGLIINRSRDRVGTALDYNSVVPSIVYFCIFLLLNSISVLLFTAVLRAVDTTSKEKLPMQNTENTQQ